MPYTSDHNDHHQGTSGVWLTLTTLSLDIIDEWMDGVKVKRNKRYNEGIG